MSWAVQRAIYEKRMLCYDLEMRVRWYIRNADVLMKMNYGILYVILPPAVKAIWHEDGRAFQAG